ncbi:hypothetical protein JBE27_32715 [Streptomyces albiflaviniger]|nr:hypothetical protein [Streptomyces albiflaviniger]
MTGRVPREPYVWGRSTGTAALYGADALADVERVGSGRGSSRSRSPHPRPRREKPATPAERAGVQPVRPRTHGGELASSPRKNGPVPVTTRSAVATIRVIEPVLASADPEGES